MSPDHVHSLKIYLILYVYKCVPECIHVRHMLQVPEEAMLDPLELGYQGIGRCNVGAALNLGPLQEQPVLQLLSYLSSPWPVFVSVIY